MADIFGDEFDNVLEGTELSDRIYGEDGNDTLYGYGGLDRLYGGAGNDTLYGGDSNDRLYGGSGDDLLDGGSGFDFAGFVDATGSVTVDLAFGTATGEGTDTLVAIEAVYGSLYDDVITGDDNGNVLHGWGGNDTFVFEAGFGDDVITGFTAGGTDDVLDFGQLGIGYEDLSIVQQGGDTLISYGDDGVLLIGVMATSLDAGTDFYFGP